MMRAAREAAEEEASRSAEKRPRVLGVTVLTSLDQTALSEVGVEGSIEDQVTRLAVLAQNSGLDGVVASPREIEAVRKRCGDEFLIVTPGIRSGAEPPDDQRRTLSASRAVSAGADYLVVGRPITASVNPTEAAERLVAEIEEASRGRP